MTKRLGILLAVTAGLLGLAVLPALAWAGAPLAPQAQVTRPIRTAIITPPETTPATETSPPEPGEPTATPEPPAAEFTVSGIEPDVVSHENGGLVSLYGTGFEPGLAVRMIDYGLLDTSVINSTAARFVVPPGVPEARYSLRVFLGNKASLTLNNALRIRSSLPRPTRTPTPGPLLAYGKPAVVIQSAVTEPDSLRPGSPFTVTLELVNRGDFTATNIRLALTSLELAAPRGGSNVSVIDTIKTNETVFLEIPAALADSAPAGYNNLVFALTYSDYYRREYSSEETVGLNIQDTVADQPLILLSSYETDPSPLSPGENFTLQMEVTNAGQTTARQVLLTFGGVEGASLSPFALIGSGNVKFIPELAAGETVALEQRFILDGSADSGVYNVPVTLEYDGPDDTQRTESQLVNLLVSRRPQLQVDFYRTPAEGLVGEPLELPIEVVNIGRNLVNVSTLQVGGPDLEIQEGSVFVGALDGGTSGSIDALVVPQSSGSLPVVVTVNYLDDFNQARQITETLTISVAEPLPEPEAEDTPSEEPGGIWGGFVRFLRGLFGLGS